MAHWLGQLQELPAALLNVGLAVVMMLDAVPVVGVLVPGDVAVLAAMGVSTPSGAAGALVWIVAGLLAGWSVGFAVGRLFGDRLRRGRLAVWVGAARWAAAERALARGSRLLVVAPFLPVLNTLVPVVAGGLRVPYLRFVRYSALGSVLWSGLYVVLGLVSKRMGGLLPGDVLALLATVVIGVVVGSSALVVARRGVTPVLLVRRADPAITNGRGRHPATFWTMKKTLTMLTTATTPHPTAASRPEMR